MEASRGGNAYGGRGAELVGVSWALTTVTTVTILSRLYIRFFVSQQVCSYKDAWSLTWAVIAWVGTVFFWSNHLRNTNLVQLFGILGTSFISIAAHYGYGNHLNLVLAQGDLSKALLYTQVWLTFSALTTVWAKFAVVSYMNEVQKTMSLAQRFTLFTLMAISLCVNVVDVFLFWFRCSPPQKLWKPSVPVDCHLADIAYNYSIFAGSWSAFVDLYLALYSAYIIFNLQLSIRLKAALSCWLGLGLFTCVCACMKTHQLDVLQNSTDKTWNGVSWILWSIAESWVMLIACSVPPIWPFLESQFRYSGHHRISSAANSRHGEKGADDLEISSTNRTSGTTATNVTTNTNTLGLNDSLAGQALDGAIAVKQEVTVDREVRKDIHGLRPRADTRSWARNDSVGLARWTASVPSSPAWAGGFPYESTR